MSAQRRLVGGSVSFDHAAETYDATRALPPAIAAQQADAILTELAAVAAERLLEVGIGTGRISRPLMEHRVRVTGLDIAPRMLARLQEQLGARHMAPDLLLGDATRLPFTSASFPAVLIVHVLHLVSDWQRTLEEIRRVLAPGGVFIHHSTRYEPNTWAPSIDKWNELLTRHNFTRRARPGAEQIASKLGSLGARLQTKVYAEDEERTTASFLLERTRERVDSWSWEIPDDVFAQCLPDYEAFMREHYGDLEREHVQRVTYELDIWNFP